MPCVGPASSTLAVLLLLGPGLTAQPAAAQTGLDWNRLAKRLVERMALAPGERVLLVGRPDRFSPLVPALRVAVTRAGAVDLGPFSVASPYPGEPTTPFLVRTTGQDRAGLVELFREADVAVMLPGANGPAYDAMQDVLREGSGRTVHFHWAGAYDRDGRPLLRVPAMDSVYQRAVLETDYRALAAKQAEFEAALRGQEIRVTTPAGTDIRFRIGDRPVTRQDGDASAARAARARNLIDREVELPAGVVRVAPQEETVEGVIAFPNSVWNGQPVRGLTLRFQRGIVVQVRAEQGSAAVEAELAAGGPSARTFREFALGFNPLLALPPDRSWIPYFGYGAGVVRLSLGDNTELGGTVGGGYVRWNFFPDAIVTVGNEVWVRTGTLMR